MTLIAKIAIVVALIVVGVTCFLIARHCEKIEYNSGKCQIKFCPFCGRELD